MASPVLADFFAKKAGAGASGTDAGGGAASKDDQSTRPTSTVSVGPGGRLIVKGADGEVISAPPPKKKKEPEGELGEEDGEKAREAAANAEADDANTTRTPASLRDYELHQLGSNQRPKRPRPERCTN